MADVATQLMKRELNGKSFYYPDAMFGHADPEADAEQRLDMKQALYIENGDPSGASEVAQHVADLLEHADPDSVIAEIEAYLQELQAIKAELEEQRPFVDKTPLYRKHIGDILRNKRFDDGVDSEPDYIAVRGVVSQLGRQPVEAVTHLKEAA